MDLFGINSIKSIIYALMYSNNQARFTCLYKIGKTSLKLCINYFTYTLKAHTSHFFFRIPRVIRIPVSHTTQDLIFLWNTTDPLVVNPEIELPQLDISNNYTTDCTIEYSTGNFTCIQIVFNLRRRLGYHLFHTYIPSALIVVMSWIAFWIKPEAIPARVTLGVTSLLTLGKARPPLRLSSISIARGNYSRYLRLGWGFVPAVYTWQGKCQLSHNLLKLLVFLPILA